jgi:hypothetical protein
MIRKTRTFATTVLFVAAYASLGRAQAPQATILQIDLENYVNYVEDIFDVSKFATDPNATTAKEPINFAKTVVVSDIVAVNGQPARGTAVFNIRRLILRPAPDPGQAIADITRDSMVDFRFEFLQTDGAAIGTIMATGLGVGSPPPGSPLAQTQGNDAIVGGTGAFLGARGQLGQGATPQTIPSPRLSMAEDPSNRRKHGGGRIRYILHVIPMFRPEVVITPNGPAITHSSDFSLVTSSKPAAAGEILSLFATGLGPTRPGVDPGQPFPSNPLVAVNSPVEVIVNGKAASVLSAAGFPGAVDGYQVNFQVPPDTQKGLATVRVTAAWIAGPTVSIAIQ